MNRLKKAIKDPQNGRYMDTMKSVCAASGSSNSSGVVAGGHSDNTPSPNFNLVVEFSQVQNLGLKTPVFGNWGERGELLEICSCPLQLSVPHLFGPCHL